MTIITAFTINDHTREDIKALIKRARENILSTEDIKKIMSGTLPPIGDTEDRSVWIGSYRVVFSLEEQPKGVYKHLSASCRSCVDGKSYLPPPEIMAGILRVFGFKNQDLPFPKFSEEFLIWRESVGSGVEAINVLERDDLGVEPDFNPPINLTLTIG